MAFVYELISQEDIKKYNIAQLHEHYSKLANPGGLYDGISRYQSWMVDRERDIWFIRVGVSMDSTDIPPIGDGKDYYILHYKDQNIEVIMQENTREGSTNVYENPFRIRWEILSVKQGLSEVVKLPIIVKIITEAMIARGYVFLEKQLPNIDVKVKYIGGKN